MSAGPQPIPSSRPRTDYLAQGLGQSEQIGAGPQMIQEEAGQVVRLRRIAAVPGP